MLMMQRNAPNFFFSLDGLNIFKPIPVAPSCVGLLKTLIGKEAAADIDDEAVAMLGGWGVITLIDSNRHISITLSLILWL